MMLGMFLALLFACNVAEGKYIFLHTYFIDMMSVRLDLVRYIIHSIHMCVFIIVFTKKYTLHAPYIRQA